jgi:hypothetical protein
MDAGRDVNMRWLPNTFPANVRVIVTITASLEDISNSNLLNQGDAITFE